MDESSPLSKEILHFNYYEYFINIGPKSHTITLYLILKLVKDRQTERQIDRVKNRCAEYAPAPFA